MGKDDSTKKECSGPSVHPIAAFHPEVGMISLGHTTEVDKEKVVIHDKEELGQSQKVLDPPETELTPDAHQFVVHVAEGSYLMDKSKWPKLTLPGERDFGRGAYGRSYPGGIPCSVRKACG